MPGRGSTRRFAAVAVLLAAVALASAACANRHPRFGAQDFDRLSSSGGVPSYSASGTLAYGETAEQAIDNVMQAACPDGNPRLLSGYTMTGQSMPHRWYAQFTCDHEIAP